LRSKPKQPTLKVVSPSVSIIHLFTHLHSCRSCSGGTVHVVKSRGYPSHNQRLQRPPSPYCLLSLLLVLIHRCFISLCTSC
jgi:hypothetical protein